MVTYLINGILASLVSITGGCALYHPWEAFIVGAIGSVLANCTVPLLNRFHVDDPVGAIAVHGTGSLWGMLAVGLFVEKDTLLKFSNNMTGLFRGGGWRLLGIQLLAIIVVTAWSMITTFALLYVINKFIPIRMTPEEEKAGADLVEHNIRYDYESASNHFPKLDLATINSIKLCIEATQTTNNRNNKPAEKLNSGTQTDMSSPIRHVRKIETPTTVNMPKDSAVVRTEREVLTAWMSDDEKNMISRRVPK